MPPAAPAYTRERLEPAELAGVLRDYDIGPVRAVHEFRRGSGRSPKVVLETDAGGYLLKRRAAHTTHPGRLACAHAVQSHLAARGYPVAPLMPTRAGALLVERDQRVYELFAFIPGTGYDQSMEAAAHAGRALAALHRRLAEYTGPQPPPARGYHASSGLAAAFDLIITRLPGRGGVELPDLLGRLRERYTDAARRADAAGLPDWPHQLVHGDWHPGNLIFRAAQVVAVIDFDSLRTGPRIADIANGVLQFSLRVTSDDVSTWPPQPDESRLRKFIRGYDSLPHAVVTVAEVECLPWLMIEALVMEAAVPIAATGTFGGLDGVSVLRMVDRKSEWIERHADRLIRGLL